MKNVEKQYHKIPSTTKLHSINLNKCEHIHFFV